MRGLTIEAGQLRYRTDLERPAAQPGETRVRVLCAGVCATDLALVRGYMGFEGVPGHEFVGEALDGPLAGQRVVGEINAACGKCAACERGLGRHCAARSVLGIVGRAGAFCEELVLPDVNLHAVPDEVPTEQATFTEPLAAAFEIAEQLDLERFGRTLVIGDGRLGLLCIQVLAAHGLEVEVIGRHPERGAFLPRNVRYADATTQERFELVVEATGHSNMVVAALERVAARGTLVLKTTTEAPVELDLAPLVVDEITVVGSRCGRFEPALAALAAGTVQVEPMIHERYALADGVAALERAAQPGCLKVLLTP